MKQGFFITIEGPDGAGKTTQLELLKKYFAKRDLSPIFTREPGGTPISEKIRGIILDKENGEMDPATEMLLYAASRAQHVAQLIRPALEHGKIVVCDRFVDSSIVYQGMAREMGPCVEEVNRYAVGDLEPDLTILLKVDHRVGMSRIDINLQDRMESETVEFHRKVCEGYLRLEHEHPERIFGVDGTLPVDEIHSRIAAKLDAMLAERERGQETAPDGYDG